jgi:hypothetical protein
MDRGTPKSDCTLYAAICLLALRLPLPQFTALHVFIMSRMTHLIACRHPTAIVSAGATGVARQGTALPT